MLDACLISLKNLNLQGKNHVQDLELYLAQRKELTEFFGSQKVSCWLKETKFKFAEIKSILLKELS